MENTKILIHGHELDYHLFKIAIDCASTGNHVWFIAPEAFTYLPEGLGFPDHHILKLIRFFYLKDWFDLLKHLNEIQSWMQVPFTLIVYKFNHYIKYSYQIAAYLICHLIDAINHCAKRISSHCYLILGYENVQSDGNLVKRMIDLYLDHCVNTDAIYEVNNILKLDI